MLMNLRNALMTGKRLPYDAEVEYLESTGTQYINIPITLETSDRIYCDFVPRASSANGAIFCSSWGNYGNLLRRDRSSNLILFGSSINVTLGSYIAGSEYSFAYGNGSGTLNGSTITSTSLSVVANTSVTLFAAPNGYNGMCAIKRFGVDGKCDYIPVRRGTVGYMYDRVSGKLFGNSGTGDFVLGPDVIYRNAGTGAFTYGNDLRYPIPAE